MKTPTELPKCEYEGLSQMGICSLFQRESIILRAVLFSDLAALLILLKSSPLPSGFGYDFPKRDCVNVIRFYWPLVKMPLLNHVCSYVDVSLPDAAFTNKYTYTRTQE